MITLNNEVFKDESGTLTNITVTAQQSGVIIEEYSCTLLKNQIPFCGENITKFEFTKLEIAKRYEFVFKACNHAGCTNMTIQHDTQNFNCGEKDQFKKISTNQICNSIDDCPIGGRDEQGIICQGQPFARNVSLVIFVYMFLVLLLFGIVKKKEFFKCKKHPYNEREVKSISKEINNLKSMMTRNDGGDEFMVKYSSCHDDKAQHSFLAALITYILSFRMESYLRHQTFLKINEVETLYHATPEGYYKCIKQRFTDNKVISNFVSSLQTEERFQRNFSIIGSLKSVGGKLIPSFPEKGWNLLCCGLSFSVTKAPFVQRSAIGIWATNFFFWSHFSLIIFNLVDVVKDITFAAAVQHFDTNIVQDYSEPEKRYEQYFDFNVQYVFIISIGLIIFSQIVTYIYWSMITRKPKFLMTCEHQSSFSRIMQLLIQYIPSTLPILLFAQDSSVKLDLGRMEDLELAPNLFQHHMVLQYEERLVEKIALNIKIIEVVCEAYGQLIIQSVILLRLKALIQTDYFKYFGISFEYVIMVSMFLSIMSIFATFWSYHVRSKQYFRQILSSSTLLQFITWILLITTKLLVYVIAFINFPGLFFVPVLIQFCVTASVLSFTSVSPSFLLSPWHDRMIHCMVCCVLPLAVSEDPQWHMQDVDLEKYRESTNNFTPTVDVNDELENEEDTGDNTNLSFEADDGINLHSFGSVTKCLSKEARNDNKRRTLQRANTLVNQAVMDKKSKNEMMLALFLYTFECLSVTAFSALMFQFYHFKSYRDFLEHFVKENASFLSFLPGYYGVVTSMCILVTVVVIISSLLITTYYKKLHPKLNLFANGSLIRKSDVSFQRENASASPRIATNDTQNTTEYFV